MHFPNSPLFSTVGVDQGSSFSGLQERGYRADHLTSDSPACTVVAQYGSRDWSEKDAVPVNGHRANAGMFGKQMKILPEAH